MIKNHSKNNTLAGKKELCSSLFSKFRGMMFRRYRPDFGLVFSFKREQDIALHMLFVFFQIDILWLDSKKKVTGIKENAKPFNPYISPDKKAKYVIEVPSGTIKRTGTSIGDRIEFS